MIFHVDVNSAFLSWTAVDLLQKGSEIDLRTVPSCIGGSPESRRSIVAAKSIPAKLYKITTGEPVSMAIRKCPELIVVPGDFDLYVRCSRAFKKICSEYTPIMESASIDEVYLDMNGMKHIYPDLIKTAFEIKDRIYRELGFTVNIGIGENKLCAKMASDFEKPNRVHTLYKSEIPKKMWPLPVGELYTCGKASARKLQSVGIKTIGDLAQADENFLIARIGEKHARHLKRFANGIDNAIISPIREAAKGYSAETTVEDDLTTFDSIRHLLMAQADVVTARMRAKGVKCRCVAVSYRTIEFKNRSHQKKLEDATDITSVVYETAIKLMQECWRGEPLRLIGLALSDIDRDGYEQISLFPDQRKDKQKKLDSALDSIRNKFGDGSIKRASTVDIDRKINRRYKAERTQQMHKTEV